MEQNNSADLLLVIDMQNVYTKGQEWACEDVEAASASILRLLNSRMPEQVIFTRYLAAEHPEGVWKEYNEMNAAVNTDAWLNHDKRMNDYPLSILFLLFFKLLKVFPDIESGAN